MDIMRKWTQKIDFNMQFIKNEIKGWGIERWNLTVFSFA